MLWEKTAFDAYEFPAHHHCRLHGRKCIRYTDANPAPYRPGALVHGLRFDLPEEPLHGHSWTSALNKPKACPKVAFHLNTSIHIRA